MCLRLMLGEMTHANGRPQGPPTSLLFTAIHRSGASVYKLVVGLDFSCIGVRDCSSFIANGKACL